MKNVEIIKAITTVEDALKVELVEYFGYSSDNKIIALKNYDGDVLMNDDVSHETIFWIHESVAD